MEFENRCHKVQEPKFDCLLFDLDVTLYPLRSGIAGHVKKNIVDYMVEKLGIDESKIENLGNLQVIRDIKGANILVGPNNEVKLADFGLANRISTMTEVHTSRTGTACWMAPEVILSTHSGKGYNLSADIWSLGCTVIEMATGKPPLHQLIPVAVIFKIVNDSTYTPEIPDNLSDEGKNFLHVCLQRDPARRPSAAALLDHPFIRNQG